MTGCVRSRTIGIGIDCEDGLPVSIPIPIAIPIPSTAGYGFVTNLSAVPNQPSRSSATVFPISTSRYVKIS
ncbi:hypothetical protein D3OALGA1CA_2634 [Olavius algarvensis associated proteobacterium Delta 3]|nr:hypothetical protein D3OALGA1CA_2634 [Olavius algarvensis associated proteobacterium Delta 3]CAB5145159.1 hypothetical protein D3OALGB2SA_4459 [Olavius algarvensis associated proteobacterium Delta 3]